MLKEIQIKDFRIFKNQKIVLGKFLTVLAGGNATGKSNILGMLANCGELKVSKGRTYLGDSFKAEFSEIFKGSKQHDPTSTDKYKIIMSDNDLNETDYRDFRIAWQAKIKGGPKDRFRIIPKHMVNGKKRENKFDLPVYYLGLSRLYPIGEAKTEGILTKNIFFKTEEHKKWYLDNYSQILCMTDNIVEISGSSISETARKTSIGINTNSYDYLTNSAGQDNLGQILLALLSFKNLKEKIQNSWRGGLLLIDEIDATLHPSAQNRLMELLIKQARELEIQIVTTTHSLNILELIAKKIEHSADINNNIELCYFTTANRQLEIIRNPNADFIKSDLLITSTLHNKPKIKLYSEDDEARWFIERLIPEYLENIEIVKCKLGCSNLVSLMNGDPSYFGNTLVVFDGDLPISTENDIKYQHLGNYIKLPGNNQNPEEVLYNYILSLPADHPYWVDDNCRRLNFTHRYFRENGPGSENFNRGELRIQRKNWFKYHQRGFEQTNIYNCWSADNIEIEKEFKQQFVNAYNKIATRLSISRLMLQ